jgi:hypothetical protein
MANEELSALFNSLRDIVATGELPEYSTRSWLVVSAVPNVNVNPVVGMTHPLFQSIDHANLTLIQNTPFDPQLLQLFVSSTVLTSLQQIYMQLIELSAHDLWTFFSTQNEICSLLKTLFISHENKVLRYHAWFFAHPLLLRLWQTLHELDIEGVVATSLETQDAVMFKKEEVLEFLQDVYGTAAKLVTGELSVSSYNSAPAQAVNKSEGSKPADLIEDNLFTLNIFLAPLVDLIDAFNCAHDHFDDFVDSLLGLAGSLSERSQSKESTHLHYRRVNLSPLVQIVVDILFIDPYLIIERSKCCLSFNNYYLSLWTQCLILLIRKVEFNVSTLSASLSQSSFSLWDSNWTALTLTLSKPEKPLFMAEPSSDITENSRGAVFAISIQRTVQEWVNGVLRVILKESHSANEKISVCKLLLMLSQHEMLEGDREQVSCFLG